jgi:hypothetical protein
VSRGGYYGSESISNGINRIQKVEGQDVVTWCTTSVPEQEKCEKLMKTIIQDKGLFDKDFIELQCKRVSIRSVNL